MKPDEAKLMKLAKDVEQQIQDVDQAIREAVAAAIDEGNDLARQLAPIPKEERIDWLRREWPGTRRMAGILLNLAQNPPGPDAPIDDLIPYALALFCENNK
jgi:hypothetical protein